VQVKKLQQEPGAVNGIVLNDGDRLHERGLRLAQTFCFGLVNLSRRANRRRKDRRPAHQDFVKRAA
jgi:hypothetical protein